MAFCDLRRLSDIENLQTAFSQSGLKIIQHQDITPQVLNALKLISSNRDNQISSVFPIILRPAVRDFAAVRDTTIYKMLEDGQMKYFCYLLH